IARAAHSPAYVPRRYVSQRTRDKEWADGTVRSRRGDQRRGLLQPRRRRGSQDGRGRVATTVALRVRGRPPGYARPGFGRASHPSLDGSRANALWPSGDIKEDTVEAKPPNSEIARLSNTALPAATVMAPHPIGEGITNPRTLRKGGIVT